MNIDHPPPRMLVRALTGALLVLAMAGPSVAGDEIVPNRRGADQPIKPKPPCAAVMNPAACKPGYVWRLARPEDLVCVTPKARERTKLENADAPDYAAVDGSNNCRQRPEDPPYVLRNAFPGDQVCVTLGASWLVRDENRAAASNRACN